MGIYAITIHRFLSVTSPVPAQILVVESWIWSKPAMSEVNQEFKRGYQLVICVGGPLRGGHGAGRPSAAELAKKRLVELGINERQILCLTQPDDGGLRTYNSAVAVRDWLRQERPEATSLNVFTLGVHARKSWVLFQKAFGPGYRVGIMAGTEKGYPVNTWWASRKGIHLVLRNTVGYLYALFGQRAESDTGA